MAIPKLARRIFGILRCLLLAHEPNRRRVRKLASGAHLGYCRHCGVQIKRSTYNNWVRDYKPREKSWRANPAYEENQSVDS